MTKQQFLRRTNAPWQMRLFLFSKLPAAWFMGIGVRSCDGQKAVVSLPYGWRAQNPFRSTYFAAQCAAGELSTGLLCLTHLQEQPPVSMLVTRVEAEFFKKADAMLLFTCTAGQEVEALIQRVVQSGAAESLTMISSGSLPDGQLASRIIITWSFKAKKRK
ncbi:MAG: DUF4442 domain-containing protein [Saprospiraceae bacterium]|nr:DUF4442 domain-containing protein [Saprospiraceae bacterium]